MPENFASYKEKIEAKFTATYLLIKAAVLFFSDTPVRGCYRNDHVQKRYTLQTPFRGEPER